MYCRRVTECSGIHPNHILGLAKYCRRVVGLAEYCRRIVGLFENGRRVVGPLNIVGVSPTVAIPLHRLH